MQSIFHASRRCYMALSNSGSYSLRRSLLRNCSWERTLEPALEVSSNSERRDGKPRVVHANVALQETRYFPQDSYASLQGFSRNWSRAENWEGDERRKRPLLLYDAHGAKRIRRVVAHNPRAGSASLQLFQGTIFSLLLTVSRNRIFRATPIQKDSRLIWRAS
jgi:hypothetical protein